MEVDPGQARPGQHGSASEPQSSQKLPVHIVAFDPTGAQELPDATHVVGLADRSQQPPLAHESPGQHA